MDPRTRARLFHAQYHDYDLDIPFWSALAREVGGPILEMGCGTGRLVNALGRLGYALVGVDHDAAMIHNARKHLDPALKSSATFIESDLISFTWPETFQLAVGALNTFAYLDDRAFSSTLASIRSLLGDHGLIALDLPPEDADPSPLGEEDSPLDVFEDPERGSSVEVRARVHLRMPGQVEVAWIYDELFPDGRVERHISEETYFQRSEETLQRLIRESGLTVRSMYGDYDFSAYQPGSDQLLVVMSKQ